VNNQQQITPLGHQNSYTDLFGVLVMELLGSQQISPELLKMKLLDYFQKKFPQQHHVSWVANITFDSFMEGRMNLRQFNDIFDALGATLTFMVAVKDVEEPSKNEGADSPTAFAYPAIWDQPVDDLDITARAVNCLKHAAEPAVEYIGQLVAMHPNALLKIVNVGHSTARNIEIALANHGLKLGTDIGKWVSPKQREMVEWNIYKLGLDPRTTVVLRQAGIVKVGDLLSKTEEEIAGIEFLGRERFYEIRELLSNKGLKLRKP
jgi:DNA-directed RNA polymerase alpha subunit